MSQFPEPLVPAEVDLRDFAFMPLDVVRLRDSDLAAMEQPEACWAAVLLWCASWHQVPAASVPDDDRVLANLAGFGRVVREWQKIRQGALRGWIACCDGRLYHPVVAEKALEAWRSKLEQRWRTECARIKKHNQRHELSLPVPEFEQWRAAGCPQGQALPVPRDADPLSPGTNRRSPATVPREMASKGQGEGQGHGIKDEPPIPPKGGRAASSKTLAVSLPTWLTAVKAKGEKAIPDGDAALTYADEVGLPVEFLHLAWKEFRHRYSQPEAKRYRDWRAVFRKAVRANWLKLWWLDGEQFALTTAGMQAKLAHGKEAA